MDPAPKPKSTLPHKSQDGHVSQFRVSNVCSFTVLLSIVIRSYKAYTRSNWEYIVRIMCFCVVVVSPVLIYDYYYLESQQYYVEDVTVYCRMNTIVTNSL